MIELHPELVLPLALIHSMLPVEAGARLMAKPRGADVTTLFGVLPLNQLKTGSALWELVMASVHWKRDALTSVAALPKWAMRGCKNVASEEVGAAIRTPPGR